MGTTTKGTSWKTRRDGDPMKDPTKTGLEPQVVVPFDVTPALRRVFESWPERFRSKVAFGDGCWEWTACRTRLGYGRFGRGGRGAGVAAAHRYAFELVHGAIPEGSHVDHLCRNTSCVRPDHLEAVTHTENVRRGKQANVAGVCRAGRHPWVAENILVEKGDVQRCRPCRNEWQRAKYRRSLAVA